MNGLRDLRARVIDLPGGWKARRRYRSPEAHAYLIDDLRARVDALEANRRAVFRVLETMTRYAGMSPGDAYWRGVNDGLAEREGGAPTPTRPQLRLLPGGAPDASPRRTPATAGLHLVNDPGTGAAS